MMYNQVKSDNLDNVISIIYSISEWGDDKSAVERIEDYHCKHRDEILQSAAFDAPGEERVEAVDRGAKHAG